MSSGIYKIVNKKNGKIYIGSTTDFKRREYDHFYYLEKGCHYNWRLQNSFNKHGKEAFEFVIIEEVEIDKLIEREQYWIDKTQCYVNGYNIQPKASSSPDRFIDPDREKIRREKIRKAFLGTKKSPEHVQKIREHRKGNKGRLGIPHDSESKRKIGEANSGENNAFAKLTNEKVREIKWIVHRIGNHRGLASAIAKHYGVSSSIIRDIITGKTWKRIKLGEEIPETEFEKNYEYPLALTKQQATEVKIKLMSGKRPSEIAKEYNVDPQSIYSIKHGQSWISLEVPGFDEWRMRNTVQAPSPK